MSEDNEKKTQNNDKAKIIFKTIIAIITVLFGFSALLFAVTNKGVMIGGGNSGTINIYNAPTSESPVKATETLTSIIEYNKSFVGMPNSLIKTDDSNIQGAQGIYSHNMNDINFEANFGSELAIIEFGVDQVGVKFRAIFDNIANTIEFEPSDLIFSNGDLLEGVRVQISPYDFDSDGINELILCITEETGGACYVFSYTKTEDKLKINGFKQELCIEMQQNIYLDKDSLIVPMGSQGLYAKYKYIDKQFAELLWQ